MSQPQGTSGSRGLAEWAATLAEKGRPEAVDDAVRMLLLDYLANLLGGASRPSARALASYARRYDGGQVPLPGGGAAPPEIAAMPWGAAAHALEFDDTHQPSSTHPGAVMFSTALPLALTLDADWPAVATAIVAGYEVMCRIGEASRPSAEYAHGFHPTGTCGVFGAAVTATLLMRGTATDIASAMGIAGSMSAGSMSFLTDGSWTKHLHPGWAAHGGIVASTLALTGYRGPERVLEPPHGYLAKHGQAEPERLLSGLGTSPLAVERTSIKAHGCCRYEQAALDAVLHLRRQHDLQPQDVAAVRVAVLDAGWNIIAEPAGEKRRPASAVDAQFSMPFGVAVALLHDRASVHEHTDEAAADPRVQALMDRVACVRDPGLDAVFPERWPAAVEIDLVDGRRLSHRVEHPKGDPENPFTWNELVDKFHDVAGALPPPDRTAVLDALPDRPGHGALTSLHDALRRVWSAPLDVSPGSRGSAVPSEVAP